MDSIKLVIVGHVDHGKSTLIGRLLYDTGSLSSGKMEEVERASRELGRETEFAYLLDHLEEERRQGVTIDTTQVFFNTEKRQYVIIDAPGHVEFVKNMITGASQADAAVLIVDVEQGVMEQTKRHAYFLSLLGLTQVIVVLNKMDLVSFDQGRFAAVSDEARGILRSLGLECCCSIPISAMQGDNIASKSARTDWYGGATFLKSLDVLRARRLSEDRPLVFPVQDVYKVDGKRIVAGRVEAGSIERGARIRILPGGRVSTVDSVERYLETRDRAVAGESIGITLADQSFSDRGTVICTPGEEPELTDRFRARVFWMARRELDRGERLAIRCATQETTCRIESIDRRIDSSTFETLTDGGEKLRNLEVGEVAVRTKMPIAITPFTEVPELGRFVLVRDEDICAGGTIGA